MNQFFFMLSVLLIGLLTGMLWTKQIPLLYILVSGFIWGSIEFVIFLLTWTWLGIPYTEVTLWIFVGTAFILLFLWNLKIGTLRIFATRENLSPFLIFIVVFVAFQSFAANKNMTQATADSFVYLMNGRSLPYLGFYHPTNFWLGSFGVLIPLLHSVSVFFEIGYLEMLHPLFYFSLLGTFLALVVVSIKNQTQNAKLAWIIAFLTTIGLGSINFIGFQMYYIHTNLVEGLFLLNALGCSWLAIVQNERKWLFPAMFSMIGFNLGRTEAPIVALLFLSAIIASGAFSRRDLALMVGPVLSLTMAWLVLISTAIGPGTRLLTPGRILIVLAGYAGMGVLIWGQKFSWVKTASKRIPDFILLGLAVLMIVLFLIRPEHMLESTINLIENLLISGRWGLTWYIVIILWILLFRENHLPSEKMFRYGLPAYLLFILALSFLRAPYHANWWDSANRMMTHLLPAALFYLAVRYAPGINWESVNVRFQKLNDAETLE